MQAPRRCRTQQRGANNPGSNREGGHRGNHGDRRQHDGNLQGAGHKLELVIAMERMVGPLAGPPRSMDSTDRAIVRFRGWGRHHGLKDRLNKPLKSGAQVV